MKIIKTNCYKGTVIRYGNEKRELINQIIKKLISLDFTEISIPIIQFQDTFTNKVGEENNNLMFNFTDRKNREICLALEYTAVIQQLAQTDFKNTNNVFLFYVQQCFRGERQQRGRWREFTQIGVEILNPSDDYLKELIRLAEDLIGYAGMELKAIVNVERGLDYYKDGRGFEISHNGLQLCGGGRYENGIGFAIGIDRLLI